MRQPARRLVACADGSLWLHTEGSAPCRMAIGIGTRLVGPSVFLDLGVASNPAGKAIADLAHAVRRANAGDSPLERPSASLPGAWLVRDGSAVALA